MIREFITTHLRPIIIGGSTFIVLVFGAIVGLLIHFHGMTAIPTAPIETPTYQTILPTGKTIAQLGGWTKISPPDGTAVYAYADKIGKISVSVSEQPIPDSFNNDVDGSVANLAASYSATDNLTAGDTKVYIGTNADGPQSTIFVKDNLLVLIKSQQKIPDASWTTYINSLNY
jgi:hypothetical protein